MAVEYALKVALLEVMVYFGPVHETMPNTEELFPFVAEVLHGILMSFCLERELEIHCEGKYLM